MVSPIGFFCSYLDSFPVDSHFSQQFAQPSGLCFVNILKKPQPIPHPHTSFPNFLTKCKCWAVSTILAYAIFSIPNNASCLDIISFKQYSDLNILVPSKIDLTKLPIGKIFQVNHSQFTLQFFFNNRDIFGFIFKRKPNIGIIAHLCFYRSCEETSYDLRKVVAKPQEPPYDKTFFSVKLPQNLQYEFQGLEFLPYK